MKYLITILAIVAIINSIRCHPTGSKNVQVKKRAFFDFSLDDIKKSIQEYSENFVKAFHRPNANINRNICVWKICSQPLKSAVMSGQQNLLQIKKNKITTYRGEQARRKSNFLMNVFFKNINFDNI